MSYQRPPCLHKEADHRCGTYVRYVVDRCRCGDCRTANNDYKRHRQRWMGEFPYAEAPLVDAAPARDHLEGLMAQGMGYKRIAERSGVPESAVGSIVWGRANRAAARIRRETETALLEVTLDLADGQKVDGTEAALIIEELRARGWTKAAIGRRIHGSGAVSLQAGKRGGPVFASTLKVLRRLLSDPVPERVHNPTGATYQPNPDHRWLDIPDTTPGVVDDDPEWLLQRSRRQLLVAVEESIRLTPRQEIRSRLRDRITT